MASLYSVTYNTNNSTGGTTPATQTAESNSETYAFTAPIAETYGLSKTGYRLVGWSENPTATIPEYSPGSTIILDKASPNKTLYAVWSNWELLPNMQTMVPAICDMANIGDTRQIIDARDNKTYWITKLADGNCWMTQNLAIDLTGKTLTVNDSDVTSDWSPVSAWGTSSNTIAWQISTTGSEHTSYGGYYTWQAATANTAPAGVGEAPSSICPKGWRLPSNNSSVGPTFAGLGLTTANILKDPYYFVYGGLVNNGSLNTAGSYGYYWSSTSLSDTTAYYLYFYSSNVNPSNSDYRYDGLSIRCVAR